MVSVGQWLRGGAVVVERLRCMRTVTWKLTLRCVVPESLQPHGLQPHQAPLSMGCSRQEHRSRLPSPPLGDLPDPEIQPHCRQVLYQLSLQGSLETYMTMCKLHNQWESALWLTELKQGLGNNPERGAGVGGGREFQEGGDTGIPMAESC